MGIKNQHREGPMSEKARQKKKRILLNKNKGVALFLIHSGLLAPEGASSFSVKGKSDTSECMPGGRADKFN